MLYLIFLFLLPSPEPFGPRPQSVGEREEEQRQDKPEGYLCHRACCGVAVGLSDRQLADIAVEVGRVGQIVMAPLAQDSTVLDEHQTGVAAYHRLECGAVGEQEGIFRARDVFPVLDVLITRCRQTVEGNMLVDAILIELVDGAEVAIIGSAQVGGDEQEGISAAVEDAVGEVVACARLYREVVDWWHIALGSLHGLRVDERPGGVGIVVKGELFLHAILFKDESCLELGLRRTGRNLHTFLDVHADMIGTEVKDRQLIEAVGACGEDEDDGVVDGYPLVGLRDKPIHAERFPPQQHSTCREYDVLQQ